VKIKWTSSDFHYSLFILGVLVSHLVKVACAIQLYAEGYKNIDMMDLPRRSIVRSGLAWIHPIKRAARVFERAAE